MNISILFDREKAPYFKLIFDIPAPDITISMGCDVGCFYIGRDFDDSWGLSDPTGQSDDVLKEVISQIERHITEIKNHLK